MGPVLDISCLEEMLDQAQKPVIMQALLRMAKRSCGSMASKDRTTSYPCPQPTGRRPGRSGSHRPGASTLRASSFALVSTRPRPHSVGYIFVAYRDTMVLRIPQAATSLVTPPPESQPLTKLTSHAITESSFLARSNARCYALQPNPTLEPTLPHMANPYPRRPHGAPPGGDRCTMPTSLRPNIWPARLSFTSDNRHRIKC